MYIFSGGANMNSVHYEVGGLVNNQSKTKINNALDKIQVVNKECVDLSRGSIEVKYNDPATSEEIKNCISSAGYTVYQ